MENITFIEVENTLGVLTKHARIDKGNGEIICMTIDAYDEMIANQQNGTIS